jgi:hypothetical protein
MHLVNLNNPPNTLPSEASPDSVGFFHDSRAFASILRVERMRSDRSGMSFALAAFSVTETDAVTGAELQISEDDAAVRDDRLAGELKRRVRMTDHVGRMADRRVGVILWDTDANGAWSFVEKAKALSEFELPLNCEVFVYPTVRPTDGIDAATAGAESNSESNAYDS